MAKKKTKRSKKTAVKKPTLTSLSGGKKDGVEEWCGGIIQLPAYVEDERPYRPFGAIWVERSSGAVVGQSELSRQRDPQLLTDALQIACETPLVGRPRVPGCVYVEDAEDVAFLKKEAKDLDVRKRNTPEIDLILSELHESLIEESAEEDASYLASGHSPEAMGQFFASAARLHHADPWQLIKLNEVFFVDIEGLGIKDGMISVVEYDDGSRGLVLMERESINIPFEDPTGSVVPWSFLVKFVRGAELPSSMRREIVEHDWPVDTPEAYPDVEAVDLSEVGRPLTSKELQVMTGSIEALAVFCETHEAELGQDTVEEHEEKVPCDDFTVTIKGPYDEEELDDDLYLPGDSKYDPETGLAENWDENMYVEDLIRDIDIYHQQEPVPHRPSVVPSLHAHVHAMIEGLDATEEQPELSGALKRLVADGLTRHEAIHAVGTILVDALKVSFVHDNDEIADDFVTERIEALDAEAWRKS